MFTPDDLKNAINPEIDKLIKRYEELSDSVINQLRNQEFWIESRTCVVLMAPEEVKSQKPETIVDFLAWMNLRLGSEIFSVNQNSFTLGKLKYIIVDLDKLN